MVLMRLHEMHACDAHEATVIVLEDVVVIRHAETDIAITCYPPDAVAIALREGLSIYATPAALDHAEPIARPDEVARWLDGIRPGDFEA